jgi:hypothetical protein
MLLRLCNTPVYARDYSLFVVLLIDHGVFVEYSHCPHYTRFCEGMGQYLTTHLSYGGLKNHTYLEQRRLAIVKANPDLGIYYKHYTSLGYHEGPSIGSSAVTFCPSECYLPILCHIESGLSLLRFLNFYVYDNVKLSSETKLYVCSLFMRLSQTNYSRRNYNLFVSTLVHLEVLANYSGCHHGGLLVSQIEYYCNSKLIFPSRSFRSSTVESRVERFLKVHPEMGGY